MPTSARCVSLRSTLGQVRDAERRPLVSVRVHLAAVLFLSRSLKMTSTCAACLVRLTVLHVCKGEIVGAGGDVWRHSLSKRSGSMYISMCVNQRWKQGVMGTTCF